MSAVIKFIDENKFDSLAAKFDKLPKSNIWESFLGFISRVKNTNNVKKGVDMIVKFRDTIPQRYHYFTDPYINDMLNKMAEKKAAGLKEQADYIRSKFPAEQKQRQ
jgi:aminopeptidase N